MAVVSALFHKNVNDLFTAFGATDTTSEEMKRAIEDCFDLYFSDDVDDEDDCQRLPVIIVNKIVKTMFAEYDSKGDNDWADRVLDELDSVKKKAMQFCLIGGEAFLKPIPTKDSIKFVPIRRDCFIPLGRDIDGKITSVGTAEFTIEDEYFYTLLEKRTVKDGRLTIENKLYRSMTGNDLGSQTALSSIKRYEDLEPVIELPIDSIGLIPIKTPIMNDVDGSNDGVAIFEPARKLIRNINRNEKQLSDEFDLLQARIVVSSDMLKSENGKQALVDKVFTGLDDNPEDVGITPFTPPFRENAYLARKTEYLRNIESLIGLKRGLLADVNEADKTATEITDSKGEYNLTIIDFQRIWTDAVKIACKMCADIGKIYKVAGAKDIDTDKLVIDYGDGVLYNRDKQWAEYLTMVQIGLIKPELALAWYFELPHDTPADLDKIRTEYMPEMQQMMQGVPQDGEA